MDRNQQCQIREIYIYFCFLNHNITADELRHCKRPDFLCISEFMASKSFLLTLPILNLAGLISL